MEFNLKRFTQLLKRDFLLHRKKTLMAIILIILALFIFTIIGHNLININAGGGLQVILLSFFGLLIFGGGFLTSSNLGDLNSAAKRTNYLSIPASSFEKVFSKWLYTLVIFLAIVSLINYGFFYGYIALVSEHFTEESYKLVEHIKTRMFFFFIMLYIIGHSIAFFFSFIFNSFAAIKGGLISVCIFLVMGVFLALFQLGSGPSFDVLWGDAIWKMMVFFQENIYKLLILAPVFWILSYFAFSRKTV